MKTKNALLDYQLTDTLEMNYSKKPSILDAVKGVLLARPIKDFNLYPLSSFVLEDALVVMGNSDLSKIKHLYILDAVSESFQFYCIHSIQKEKRPSNGKKVNDSFRYKRLTPA